MKQHPANPARRPRTFAIALLFGALFNPPLSANAASSTQPEAPVDPAWGPALERSADRALEARLDTLLARMSLEQKIGQIIQAEIQHVTPEQVARYHLGSILNGGGSFPDLDRKAAIEQWTRLSAAFHQAARGALPDRQPAIPLLWGTDAVHGHNNVFGATIFPHNIGLGASRNPDLVRRIGRATAADVAATGIDWNFAPTLAVSTDLRWGRAYESFSSDPALVAELGRAAVLGLQGEPGDDWLGHTRVLATAKHFVGDGGTHHGVDQGDTRLSEAALARIHGLPYRPAIAAGVQTVMASFSSWNGTKMHGHRYLLTEVLKNHLGFDGFVIGDWNGHGQIPGCTVSDCIAALNAGVDMFMVPENWLEFRTTMLAHARAGRLPMERLNDAVRRILRVKLRAGLFDGSTYEDRIQSEIGDHAALARQAVRESLVLLKNNDSVLPLDPRRRIAVVGDGADDIGKQSGGWTLDWQGVTGTNESFPNGESIWQGLAAQISAAGGRAHLGEQGLAEFKPEAVIAVIGEDPYAEGQGDLATLEFQAGTREGLDLLDRLAAYRAPVVTVFLSGRPLWVNPELNRSDAFIAAWLPGTAGGGIADVVLRDATGEVQHAPSGKLSFAWPATPTPAATDDPALFEFGFGLSYAAAPALPALPEDGMAPRAVSFVDRNQPVVFDGAPHAPWKLVLRDASSQHTIGVDGQIARTSSAEPLIITPTDRQIQGDARRVQWSGASGDAVGFMSNESVDLSALARRGLALAFDLRPESSAAPPVTLALECGGSCAPGLPLASLAPALEPGVWQRIRIPLDCLADDDTGLARVTGIFVLTSAEPAEISFANIALEPSDTAELRCPE